MAEAVRREVAAEPRSEEPMGPLIAQEGPADKSAEVVLTEKTGEPAVELPPKEKAEPLLSQKVVGIEHPAAEARVEEPSMVAEPRPGKAPETSPGATSIVFRTLPWAAAGAVFLMLLCVTGVMVVRVAGTLPEIGFPSLQLSSLWPGALLLVSVASFAGAILLIGLFLWARRSAPG